MRLLLTATMSVVVAACSFASLSGFSGGDDEDGGVSQADGAPDASDAPSSGPDATTDAGGDGPVIPSSGWQYEKRLTIDKSVVSGGATLADFPVLFSTVDGDFKTTAYGGKLVTGNDLAFFDESGQPLAFEIETYESTTGRLIAWIKLPLLTPTAGAVFGIRVGNAKVTQKLENRAAVWSNDFAAVWHMADATWTSSVTGATGTPVGGPAIVAAGKIGTCVTFGSTNTNVDVGSGAALQPTSITVSAWASPDTVGSAPDRHPYMILQDQYNDTTPRGYYMEIYRTQTNPSPTFYTGTVAGIAHAFATTDVVNGTWYHVVGTRDE